MEYLEEPLTSDPEEGIINDNVFEMQNVNTKSRIGVLSKGKDRG